MPAHSAHSCPHRLIVLGLGIFVLFGEMARAQQQVETAATLAFLEGPTANRDGNVYFVEMVTPRIMKLGNDGVLTTYRDKSNNANGLSPMLRRSRSCTTHSASSRTVAMALNVLGVQCNPGGEKLPAVPSR